MMRTILVIGSIRSDDEDRLRQFQQMGHAVGRAVILAGNKLLNGGRDEPANLDKYVAAGAAEACDEKGLSAKERILSIIRPEDRAHGIGRFEEVLGEGDVEKRLSLVQRSDALVVLGGAANTREYLVLAELNRTLIIPIPLAGGTAKQSFDRFRHHPSKYFPASVTDEDLFQLNQMPTSPEAIAEIAQAAVTLAKKSLSESDYIFIATPFTARYTDTLLAIKLAVEKVNKESTEVQYVCERLDEILNAVRLDEEIEKRVAKARIVIADVSEPNANVYYEAGFARGRRVYVIPIATVGSELAFDIRMVKTEFYNLKAGSYDEMQKAIEAFAECLKRIILAVPREREAPR